MNTRRRFTAAQDARIREMLDLTDAEIAQRLNRPSRAVTRRRLKLGLFKMTEETLTRRRATMAEAADPPPQPGVTIHRCR